MRLATFVRETHADLKYQIQSDEQALSPSLILRRDQPDKVGYFV